MPVTHHIFQYKDSKLHFAKLGSGQYPILCFHGFGQDHTSLRILGEGLESTYTLYVFDLFFHGQSEWGYGEQPLEQTFWNELLRSFLNEHSIKRFSLLGFSLGGRFVLTTIESFAEDINKVILIAPDGIKTSFWYNLATYPILLRKLFKSMILHPERFHAIANTLREIRVMDKGLIRFAESQMNTVEKRRRVYFSWVVFRHIQGNHSKIIKLVSSNTIKVTFIVGSFDKVITPKTIKQFAEKLPNAETIVLEAGHNTLINKLESERILAQILSK